MPDNTAIISVLYQTQGVDSLKAANAELDKSQKAAKGVGDETRRAGETAGIGRREFARTGTEAAYAMTLISGKAGAANAALAGTVRVATELGQAFLYGGAFGAGIVGASLAVGALFDALNTTTPQTTAFKKEIDGLSDSATDAAKGLAQLSGATDDDATKALAAAKANHEYALKLKEAADAQIAQKNPLEQVGDTLGLLVKGTQIAAAETITYNRALAEGKTEQEAYKLALEAGQIAQIGMTYAQRDHLKAVVDEAPALLEHNRLLDLMKTNLPNIVKENDAFAASMDKLTDAHKKAVASFGDDMLAADAKASADRIALQVDTARSIEKIYGDLGTRLGDMADDASARRAQDEHDWLRTAQGFANDRAQFEQDLADKLAGIQQDAQDQIAGIQRDAVRAERTGTWQQVLAIREKAKEDQEAITKKAAAEAAAANKDADKSRTALTTRQRDALDEHNYKEGLAEQASIKAAQRTRRDADTQSEEARRTERERETAINVRLGTEKAAIQKRADAESASYIQSQKDASAAHAQRMIELRDTRTEQQRISDAWDNIRLHNDWATQSAIIYSGVLKGIVNWIPGDYSTFQKPKGWYAGGLDTVISRPTVIGVGESGAERVTVTPLSGGDSKQGAGGVNFYNCTFRDVADVYAAIDRRDRGL